MLFIPTRQERPINGLGQRNSPFMYEAQSSEAYTVGPRNEMWVSERFVSHHHMLRHIKLHFCPQKACHPDLLSVHNQV
jgi:hypothetical protein